jgi:hypothetical protein
VPVVTAFVVLSVWARSETHEERHTKIDIDEFKSGTTNITLLGFCAGIEHKKLLIKKLLQIFNFVLLMNFVFIWCCSGIGVSYMSPF